jgi:hypothetical protein
LNNDASRLRGVDSRQGAGKMGAAMGFAMNRDGRL